MSVLITLAAVTGITLGIGGGITLSLAVALKAAGRWLGLERGRR